MRTTATSLAWLLLAAPLLAADAVDLQKIDRQIGKQPTLAAEQPLYGLLVLGPKAEQRIWLILDKSKPGLDQPDVLYADLNGNGDLTETAERFSSSGDGSFSLPDLKDPATGATHTEVKVRMSGRTPGSVMVSLKWRGNFRMGGGYPEDPEAGYLKFGTSPATAPILRADGDGPFRFQRWYSGKLAIGQADDFKVFIGHPGSGESSFWAFQQHVLPEKEGVQATLIYQDAQGKEQKAVYQLMDRC